MDIFKESQQKPYIKLIPGALLVLVIPVVGTLLTDAPVIWPISVLIYNLGLVYSLTIVPKKIIRVITYNIIAAIFFVIEASFFFSYFLQNTGFNEAFFYHIRPDLLYAGLREHLLFILVIIFCLFGSLALFSSALSRLRSMRSRLTLLALGFLLLGLFISPPIKALVQYTGNLSSPTNENNLFENFRELLSPKISIKFSKSNRPNIVLIYAESLEQRFFDETLFPDLVTNLKKLKEHSIDFVNVSQGVGAGWTIGGIVASQCGYPLAGSHGVEDNDLSIFDNFLPKLTCLGDLFKKDNYRLTFIGGADARFGGKHDFLISHGYDEIIDLYDLQETLIDKSYLNPWGVFDDTLFDYAFEKFRAMSREETPFLLTLLTLDAHGPIGYLSKSCGTYGTGDNSNLNSFHCSDQLISRFIEQIRNSQYSRNTMIVVLSDHLSMRNKATPMLKASQMPSRLVFFVNTPDSDKSKNINPGTHYDIAPTILDLAGYKITGHIGFGAPLTRGPGYLPGKFGEKEWVKESANLMAIGRSLWDNEVNLDQKGIEFTVSNLSLTMGGREFNLRAGGILDDPASALFIFDVKSLKLEKIKVYALDRDLKPETLSKALLNHVDKLTLVIGRAGNLPGFSDPRNHPDQWFFFCGKPGGELFTSGLITSDFLIPFDLILKLSKSDINDRVVKERKQLLHIIGGDNTERR